MLLETVAFAIVVGVLALSLVVVGYWTVGGPFVQALAAARGVVGTASSWAERLTADTGRVELTIDTPDLGTYREAAWLVVAEGDTVTVTPEETVVRAGDGPLRVPFRVEGASASSASVEVAVYDLASMRMVARMTAVLPPAGQLSRWARFVRSVVGRVRR